MLAVAPTASAKWILGNGQTDIEITAPDPAQPFQVCFDRVQGRAGLNTPDDPAVTPPPPGPYTPITVRVFAGPSGTLDGATVQGDGTLLLLDGTPLEPAATQVTSAPTAVDPPESYFGDFSETFLVWEYAAAPFDIAIPAGKSAPGDEGARRAAGVASGLRHAWRGRVLERAHHGADRPLPGSTLNRVAPSDKQASLVVRLYGSATLDVRNVTDVKLGNAAAAPIPAGKRKRFLPHDRDKDGYLDRDFLFVPAATGITCSSTSVSLTGEDGGRDAVLGNGFRDAGALPAIGPPSGARARGVWPATRPAPRTRPRIPALPAASRWRR